MKPLFDYTLSDVPVDAIAPGTRARQRLHLEPLIESVRRCGLLEPVLVCRHPANDEDPEKEYFLLSGYRRWLAAQHLKLTRIPALVIWDRLSYEEIEALIWEAQETILPWSALERVVQDTRLNHYRKEKRHGWRQ